MYVSGEIAGNTSPRSEPVMDQLLEDLSQIHYKLGSRFSDTFSDEFMHLANIMSTEEATRAQERSQRVKQLTREWGAPPVPKPSLVLNEEQQAPQHEPRHDIESVFWVHICCLVRALPDGADDNPTEQSDCIINDMLYHEVPPSASTRRDEALRWTRTEWERALHPRLQMLAPMVVRMCELLCINWRIRSTPQNRFLLHQGFKRLLLMQVREIEEKDVDVQLNTKKPRAIYARKPEEIRKTVTGSSLRASGCNSSQDFPIHQVQRPKRGSDSITDPGETASSRKRAKLDRSARSSPQSSNDSRDGSLSPSPSGVGAPDFLVPTIEGPVQPGTEGTVDDDGEDYEERSQEQVDEEAIKAISSLPEDVRKTIVWHRGEAGSLVKMHLDDEAWHRVTVKPDNSSPSEMKRALPTIHVDL
jgi:hypothetical protein